MKQYKGYVTTAGRQYVPEVNTVPIRRQDTFRPFSQALSGLREALATTRS